MVRLKGPCHTRCVVRSVPVQGCCGSVTSTDLTEACDQRVRGCIACSRTEQWEKSGGKFAGLSGAQVVEPGACFARYVFRADQSATETGVTCVRGVLFCQKEASLSSKFGTRPAFEKITQFFLLWRFLFEFAVFGIAFCVPVVHHMFWHCAAKTHQTGI